METSTKIGLGSTAVGLAAGTAAGVKIGNMRAEKIIDDAKVITSTLEKVEKGTKGVYKTLTKDEYINSKVGKQVKNLTEYQKTRVEKHTFEPKKLGIILGNIRKEAATKFEKCCTIPDKAYEIADKSKTKWIKGMALAGLALGALVGYAIKNNTNHTTINDGDTIIKVSSEKTTQAKKKAAKEKAQAKAEVKMEKKAEKQALKAAKAEAKAAKELHKQQEAEAVCAALKSV